MATNVSQPKRRGRPPVPPEDARSHRVVTFVNAREFELLSKLSKESNAPLSTIVHGMLCECLTKNTR